MKRIGPIVGVLAVGVIAWVVFQSRVFAMPGGVSPVPPTPPPPPPGTTGPTGADVAAGLVKLAGQATAGGVPGLNPSATGPNATSSTAAVRIAGAGVAATGVLTWLQAHNTPGRIVGGTESGAGLGTTIAPGIGTAIGAGIGALVGWISSFNANDTKYEREQFAKQTGFASFDAMMRAVGWGTDDLGGALFVEATQRIGRKDRAWNQDWMARILARLQGQQVHAYRDDPTKGAQPII